MERPRRPPGPAAGLTASGRLRPPGRRGPECCPLRGHLGLVVVGGHEGHLGDGRVVLLAAHLHLEGGARFGHRLVHVAAGRWRGGKKEWDAGSSSEAAVGRKGGGCGAGLAAAPPHRASSPPTPHNSNSRMPVKPPRAHPMAMFFLRQGEKAPEVISPTFLPSGVSTCGGWGGGEAGRHRRGLGVSAEWVTTAAGLVPAWRVQACKQHTQPAGKRRGSKRSPPSPGAQGRRR